MASAALAEDHGDQLVVAERHDAGSREFFPRPIRGCQTLHSSCSIAGRTVAAVARITWVTRAVSGVSSTLTSMTGTFRARAACGSAATGNTTADVPTTITNSACSTIILAVFITTGSRDSPNQTTSGRIS